MKLANASYEIASVRVLTYLCVRVCGTRGVTKAYELEYGGWRVIAHVHMHGLSLCMNTLMHMNTIMQNNHVHTHTHMYTHARTRTNADTHAHTHAHICTHVHAHTHTRTRTRTHTQTYAHTHTHTHTHTTWMSWLRCHQHSKTCT